MATRRVQMTPTCGDFSRRAGNLDIYDQRQRWLEADGRLWQIRPELTLIGTHGQSQACRQAAAVEVSHEQGKSHVRVRTPTDPACMQSTILVSGDISPKTRPAARRGAELLLMQ